MEMDGWAHQFTKCSCQVRYTNYEFINFNTLILLILNYPQVKVTPKHNEESQRLLTLMGIPYIQVCTKVSFSREIMYSVVDI